jgi:hypothetical protein
VTNTATDTDLPADTLSYQLLTAPAGASLSADGVITWTPGESFGSTTNPIVTVVSDGVWSATNSFLVTVLEGNSLPVFPGLTNVSVVELTLLSVTNTATDSDVPVNTLTYQLLTPPAGMSIDTNSGVITWTPTEAQGPSTNAILTVVSDGTASVTNTLEIVVLETNRIHTLPTQKSKSVSEWVTLTVTNTATDLDVPVNVMTYTLLNPPTGAVISTNGIITWTPNDTQGGTTNFIVTVATDNGTPALSVTNTFAVVVTDVNNAPVLPVIPTQFIPTFSALVVTNQALDPDVPPNQLNYTLTVAPAGATISAAGVINWTAAGASTNVFTTVVADNGTPVLRATNSFTVIVGQALDLTPPDIQSVVLANGVATVTWRAVSGQTYRLQYKDELTDSVWTDRVPDVLATGTTATATNAAVVPQRFYRVVLPVPVQ